MQPTKSSAHRATSSGAIQLCPPPALSRIERIRRKAVVHRSDDELGYEGRDHTTRSLPTAGASIVQGGADAPRVFIIKVLGDDGRLAFACATTSPADLFARCTRRPRIRLKAGRMAA